MDNEELNFEEMNLDEAQVKFLIKARKKGIKAIFKKYSCPEHKQLAKLRSVTRENGGLEVDFATCCENHRDLLQRKVNVG